MYKLFLEINVMSKIFFILVPVFSQIYGQHNYYYGVFKTSLEKNKLWLNNSILAHKSISTSASTQPQPQLNLNLKSNPGSHQPQLNLSPSSTSTITSTPARAELGLAQLQLVHIC